MDSLFNKAPLYLYSQTELPPAGITQCNLELSWFGDDTHSRYQKKPHPLFTADEITYRFNSKGYRCQEPTAAMAAHNALKVISIGASEVFGIGLPVANTFPQVFCDKISSTYGCKTINWNLGVSGASADYISRILYSALPVLKPDIVLIVFPPLLRREYVNDTDRLFIYTDRLDSRSLGARLFHRMYDPEKSRQNDAHRALSSAHADQINFFKNYQLCESLCTRHNVMWLFSPFTEGQLRHTRELVSPDHLVLPGLLDLRDEGLKTPENSGQILARDMGHPGITPNVKMAELFLAGLQALYPQQLLSAVDQSVSRTG